MGVEAVVAFAGGVLALLSPCSALLLPAFFAYAYPSTRRLVFRTGVFYLGLLTLFLPLGLGLGALGSLFLERRAELSLIAGLLLIVVGAFQLVVGGFELPGAARLASSRLGVSGESLAATYALGLVYGFGGFCSGPILGGVLTIAGASGGAVAGSVLLAIFAAGMAAPLLLMAMAWERLGAKGRARLRGREIRVGPWTRHSTIVVSSVLFVVLGVIFIVFQGGNALSGVYGALGLADFSVRIETLVREVATASPWLAPAIIVVGLGTLAVRRRRAR